MRGILLTLGLTSGLVVACAGDERGAVTETMNLGTPPSGAASTPEVTSRFDALVVSLTFDDTLATHASFVREALGPFPATFYVNSSRIGHTGYLTRTALDDLARAGHEIGSHTLTHRRLTALPPAEQTREICDDRAALVRLGFPVQTLAYPFGDENEAVRRIAEQDCSLMGARDIGGLLNSNVRAGGNGYCGTPKSWPGAPDSESLPPKDRFSVRSRASILNPCTVTDLNDMVLAAASDRREKTLESGRWLVFNFHDFCDDCTTTTTTVRKAVFREFMTWLGDQQGQVSVLGADGLELGRRPMKVKTIASVLAP